MRGPHWGAIVIVYVSHNMPLNSLLVTMRGQCNSPKVTLDTTVIVLWSKWGNAAIVYESRYMPLQKLLKTGWYWIVGGNLGIGKSRPIWQWLWLTELVGGEKMKMQKDPIHVQDAIDTTVTSWLKCQGRKANNRVNDCDQRWWFLDGEQYEADIICQQIEIIGTLSMGWHWTSR